MVRAAIKQDDHGNYFPALAWHHYETLICCWFFFLVWFFCLLIYGTLDRMTVEFCVQRGLWRSSHRFQAIFYSLLNELELIGEKKKKIPKKQQNQKITWKPECIHKVAKKLLSHSRSMHALLFQHSACKFTSLNGGGE